MWVKVCACTLLLAVATAIPMRLGERTASETRVQAEVQALVKDSSEVQMMASPKYDALKDHLKNAKKGDLTAIPSLAEWKLATPGGTWQGRGKGKTGPMLAKADTALTKFGTTKNEANAEAVLAVANEYFKNTHTATRTAAFQYLQDIGKAVVEGHKEAKKQEEIKAMVDAAKGKKIVYICDKMSVDSVKTEQENVKKFGATDYGEYMIEPPFFPFDKAIWNKLILETTEVVHFGAHGSVLLKDGQSLENVEEVKKAVAIQTNQPVRGTIILSGDTVMDEVYWDSNWIGTLDRVPSKLVVVNTCWAGYNKDLACGFICKGTDYVIAHNKPSNGRSLSKRYGNFYEAWKGGDDATLVEAFDTHLHDKRGQDDDKDMTPRLFAKAANTHKSTHTSAETECTCA